MKNPTSSTRRYETYSIFFGKADIAIAFPSGQQDSETEDDEPRSLGDVKESVEWHNGMRPYWKS
jgi:hypothetical protein